MAITAKKINKQNIAGNLKSLPRKILLSVLPVIVAFFIGAILIASFGKNPFEAYYALFFGALAGRDALFNTLYSATPLIFTGLAIGIAFKANIYNMGVEGQLHFGALASAVAGFAISGLPPFLHVFIAILCGMAAGALFALIPAILKAYFYVNEMVVTIMLNYVAILMTTYLAAGPLHKPGPEAATWDVLPSAVLPRLSTGSQLSVSFLIALLAFIIILLLYKKTKLGYEINSIGKNVHFSEATGMNVSLKIIIIMLISGALGGLGGAGEILGTHGRFVSKFSPGYGWDGMTIALLGKNNPIGILIAALFFGILKNGGSSMELMVGVPRSLISIIQGLIIFFLAVDFISVEYDLKEKFSTLKNRNKKVKEVS